VGLPSRRRRCGPACSLGPPYSGPSSLLPLVPEARSGRHSIRLIVNGRGGAQGFDVVIWERLAGTVAQTQRKGSLVLIGGRLAQRQWETPQGDKRSRVEIVATDVQFLSPRQSS